MSRHQRGGAGGIHRERWAAQIQQVRKPIGRYPRTRTARGVHVDVDGGAAGQPRVLIRVDSQEHAGAAARKPIPPLSCRLQRLDRDLQEQSVLRIHVQGFARRNAEERRIEMVDFLDEPRPHAAGNVAIIQTEPATLGRNRLRCAIALQQPSPELQRGSASPRHPASHRDNGDRLPYPRRPLAAVERPFHHGIPPSVRTSRYL